MQTNLDTTSEPAGHGGSANGPYYNPYDVEIDKDPYPVWKRLRDEQPLYYNEKHDFYALSRFDDVETCQKDWRRYSSSRGTLLELIKGGVEAPPGTIIFEDPPQHDLASSAAHGRLYTPQDRRARAKGARILRPQPRPARGEGRIRLHRGCGGPCPDADHRPLARHSRGGPAGHS